MVVNLFAWWRKPQQPTCSVGKKERTYINPTLGVGNNPHAREEFEGQLTLPVDHNLFAIGVLQ